MFILMIIERYGFRYDDEAIIDEMIDQAIMSEVD